MLATVVVQTVVLMFGVAFGVVVGLAALAGLFALAERFAPGRTAPASR